MATTEAPKPTEEWNTFLSQVKAIEKKDSNMTSDQQIERLHKPGAKYLNLNPFYVSFRYLRNGIHQSQLLIKYPVPLIVMVSLLIQFFLQI